LIPDLLGDEADRDDALLADSARRTALLRQHAAALDDLTTLTATTVPDTLTRPAHWLPGPRPGQHEAARQARGMPRAKTTAGGGGGVGGRNSDEQRTGRGGRGKRSGGAVRRSNGTGQSGHRPTE
ncbi:pentapeptide repeat-containing protein, partial [Streptomyces oryzae]|nr:pentapeptide repeat-containing protein [Streptomyces oryzae]